MTIRVNNESRSVTAAATLFDLLRELALTEHRGVAVAINDTVVPRAEWPARALCEADHVLVIQATAGG